MLDFFLLFLLLLFTFEQATQFVYLLYLFIIKRHGRGRGFVFLLSCFFSLESIASGGSGGGGREKRGNAYIIDGGGRQWSTLFCLFFCKCLSIYCFFFSTFIYRLPLYHQVFFFLCATLLVFLFYFIVHVCSMNDYGELENRLTDGWPFMLLWWLANIVDVLKSSGNDTLISLPSAHLQVCFLLGTSLLGQPYLPYLHCVTKEKKSHRFPIRVSDP